MKALWDDFAMAATSPTPDPNEFRWSRVSKAARHMRFKDYEGAQQGVFAASFINVFAWIAVAAVLISGLVLVNYEDPSVSRHASFFERHSQAGTGIILAVAGFIQLMVVVMVANFVKATLAFQAEAGAFFAAFKRGLDEELDPRTIVTEVVPKSAVRNQSSKSSASTTKERDAEPSDRTLALPAVRPDKVRSGTPSDHDSAPGWYADPNGNYLRWWEGDRWGDMTGRAEGD